MVHEVDRVRNGLGLALIGLVHRLPQHLLGVDGKLLASLGGGVKHLCPVVLGVGEHILMDAQQHPVFRPLHHRYPVFQVRDLLLS